MCILCVCCQVHGEKTKAVQGFKLEFVFQENPYFSDKSLFKTYLLSNNPDSPYGDMVYEKAEGSKISWKADKNLAVKIEVKKQRHKGICICFVHCRIAHSKRGNIGTKETRTIKKSVPRETFFTFFTPLQVPENEEDFDEDDLPEDYEERIQMDYEVGETLKEKIIPRAVDWYVALCVMCECND